MYLVVLALTGALSMRQIPSWITIAIIKRRNEDRATEVSRMLRMNPGKEAEKRRK